MISLASPIPAKIIKSYIFRFIFMERFNEMGAIFVCTHTHTPVFAALDVDFDSQFVFVDFHSV